MRFSNFSSFSLQPNCTKFHLIDNQALFCVLWGHPHGEYTASLTTPTVLTAPGLQVRIDQALPSDHLASAILSWPAVVSARIGGDMDGGSTWTQMASTGAFLSAIGIRPIMDVLWTQPVDTSNTRTLCIRSLECACLGVCLPPVGGPPSNVRLRQHAAAVMLTCAQ